LDALIDRQTETAQSTPAFRRVFSCTKIRILKVPASGDIHILEVNMSRLVIAEKHSVGQQIAAVIGASKKQEGYNEGNGYLVSWCVGHLIELANADAYDERYKKWNLADLPILPEKWKYTVSQGKGKQMKILSELMKRKDVDTVICATDAGREGELIFRLVYNHAACKKPVKRLWISSMEESAIREGFTGLKPGAEYENLYKAALCRSQADWLVGINATRFYSCLYGGTLLNVGRVMSPTLAMLTERENAIRNFVKTPFYNVLLDCGKFVATSEKTKEKGVAEQTAGRCDGKTAVAVNVESKEKSAAPPKLYDLTTLQRDANRIFGLTAQQTLDTAQKLYEAKLLTYPRTDSNYITEDMAERTEKLANLAALLLPYAKVPIPVNVKQVVNGKKVSDHHALIPTETALGTNLDSLSPAERNIMTLVILRLISAVGKKHVYKETVITVECEETVFKAKGRVVLDAGFKEIEDKFKATLKSDKSPDDQDESEKELPPIEKGMTFSPVSASVKEGFTTPPKRYTGDTLLSAMETAGAEDMPDDAERKGLGTPATRAGILDKLIKSGFVERQKKNLVPTEKAETLISVLPDTLKSAKLTAEWEHRLKETEKGVLSADSFMNGIIDMTKRVVAENVAPDPEKAALFGGGERQGKEAAGKCPRCGKNVIDIGKGYVCEDRACKFAIWKENKWFAAKKKKVTKEIASALLKDGRVFIKGLYSDRTKKTYDATVALDDTGEYINFKLEF
jgi:DNA topoisomerase-3